MKVCKFKARWITGANKGTEITLETTDEKLKVGAVRSVAWGWKYKVIRKIKCTEVE